MGFGRQGTVQGRRDYKNSGTLFSLGDGLSPLEQQFSKCSPMTSGDPGDPCKRSL